MTTDNTLVIDLETGGLDPKTDAVCSISVKKYGEGIVKTWYLKPYGKRYTAKAISVNGLHEEYLEINGIDHLEFISQFIGFLYSNFDHDKVTKKFKQKIKLLGQNVQFDIQHLKELLPLFDEYFDYHYKDTMITAEFLRDAGLLQSESISLVEVYKYIFGEDKLSYLAHSSGADVLMCEKLYKYFTEEALL